MSHFSNLSLLNFSASSEGSVADMFLSLQGAKKPQECRTGGVKTEYLGGVLLTLL